MKTLSKILLGSLFLAGLQFALSGCITEGYVSESVYYGPQYRDPWFRDDPWMDGRRWNRGAPHAPGVDIYINPPRRRH
jgi:hypothetical protein